MTEADEMTKIVIRVADHDGSVNVETPWATKVGDDVKEIVALGCSYEGANPSYICIDIPPETEFDAILEYLVRNKDCAPFRPVTISGTC